MTRPIRKLLIANRGEIACRVIRSCRELGISSVGVNSDADASALHVTMADEAVRVGPAPVTESYLRGEAIIEAAKATGADAIHPGYGFLSENPEFVEAVEAAGLIFVGPSAEAIRAMGLKDGAKALMAKAGVPIVPGYHGEAQDVTTLLNEAEAIGYPVLIKARAGGGGKGMRLVDRAEEFAAAFESAAREAQASFGDGRCLVEKFINAPRHIEVQVFGDSHGNVVHLFERDCSLQRRHQKVIEEAPAPGMTEELRAAMGAAAVAAAKSVGYSGAGTVEFIVDGEAFPSAQAFWFMEMNTRLQVEHPVTELVTGLDLVALQIAVAEGRPLPFAQDDLKLHGHAVEARLYAEDPALGFLPATGRLDRMAFPSAARVDTGVRQGDEVTPHYDPMIAKIITSGPDRASAFSRLAGALRGTHVEGPATNRDFLHRLVTDKAVLAGEVDTGLIAARGEALTKVPPTEALDWALAALAIGTGSGPLCNFRLFGPARRQVAFDGEETLSVWIETDGKSWRLDTPVGGIELAGVFIEGEDLTVVANGHRVRAKAFVGDGQVTIDRDGIARRFSKSQPGRGAEKEGAGTIAAPMTGRIIKVSVEERAQVTRGQALLVLEAMKMEHTLTAPRDGRIARLAAAEGQQVTQGAILVEMEDTAE